jgi:hypothetical protein
MYVFVLGSGSLLMHRRLKVVGEILLKRAITAVSAEQASVVVRGLRQHFYSLFPYASATPIFEVS